MKVVELPDGNICNAMNSLTQMLANDDENEVTWGFGRFQTSVNVDWSTPESLERINSNWRESAMMDRNGEAIVS
jgi:hypothetical protein